MTVKAVEESRPVQAQEWALRWADGIAEKHLQDLPQSKRFAVAADIAEALQMSRLIFEDASKPLSTGESQ